MIKKGERKKLKTNTRMVFDDCTKLKRRTGFEIKCRKFSFYQEGWFLKRESKIWGFDVILWVVERVECMEVWAGEESH